VTSEKCIK